jgi:hypothetical protein
MSIPEYFAQLPREKMTNDITLKELETFFSTAELPASVELGPGEKITDLPKFVKNHLQVLKDNPPLVVREPYWVRLIKLYTALSK